MEYVGVSMLRLKLFAYNLIRVLYLGLFLRGDYTVPYNAVVYKLVWDRLDDTIKLICGNLKLLSKTLTGEECNFF